MSTLTTDLVLKLPLNVITGNEVMDESGNSHNGTLNGATLNPDTTFGNAMQFDGTNDYISLGTSDLGGVFAEGNSTFCVTLWAKPDSLGTSISNHGAANVMLAKASNSNNDIFELGISADGNLHVYIDENATDATRTLGNGELTVGSWHFIALNFDSGSVTAWLDGTEYSSSFSGSTLDSAEGSEIAIGCTRNNDIYFDGKIYSLRAWNRTLSADEIESVMEDDQTAAASFRTSYPLDFDLADEQDSGVLYIDEDAAGNTLTLTLENKSGTILDLISGATGSISPDNYHFQLCFRPGTLSDDTLQNLSLSESHWEMSQGTNTDGTEYILFLSTTNRSLADQDSLTLSLSNISADSSQGSRSTQVELLYQQLYYSGSTSPVSGSRVMHISIINHTGYEYTPLHTGFTGSNTILNNKTDNSLSLRISNPTDEDIALNVGGSTPTRFILSFDTGSDEEEWNLEDTGVVNNIIVSLKDWSVTPPDQAAQEPEWIIENQSADNSIPAGGFIQIDLSNIITAYQTGTTHLYLNYENLPGYWDGQFVVEIQKAPMIFRNDNVGVKVANPHANLTVDSHLRLLSETGSRDTSSPDDSIFDYLDVGHDGTNGYLNTYRDGNLQIRQAYDTILSFQKDTEGNAILENEGPGYALNVKGGVRNLHENTSWAYTEIGNNGTDGYLDVNVKGTGNLQIRQGGNAKLDFLLDPEGNTGLKNHGDRNALAVVGGVRGTNTEVNDNQYTEIGHDGGNPYINGNGSVLEFQVESSSKMYLSFEGKLGIGTSSPDQALSVVGTVRGAYKNDEKEYTEIGHNGGDGYINTSGDGNLLFQHDGNSKMYLNASGNLGVDMSPQHKLSAKGSIAAHNSSDTSKYTRLVTEPDKSILQWNGVNDLYLAVGNTARWRFASTGMFQVNGYRPIKIVRYKKLGDSIQYNTGYSTSDWIAGISGFVTQDVEVKTNNDGDFIKLYMYQSGGTWWIRANIRNYNDSENWYVDVMFIRTEFGSLSGDFALDA